MKFARRSAIAGSIGALFAVGPALAASVQIPALPGGTASVRLVLAADGKTQVLGFAGAEWATAYSGVDLAAAATLTLTPTADIATAGGGATCYRIMVAASGGRGGDWCVQVPDDDQTHALADLVGASTIDPASLTAGRLLPATTGAAPGWGLILDPNLAPVWSAAAGGGCTTLACLLDGPGALGTVGQVPTVAAGGTAWAWATPSGPATWGAIGGTLAEQLDLAAALAGKQPAGAYLTAETDPTVAGAIATHAGAADPHPGYRLESSAVPWGELSSVPTAFAPSGHAASHAASGADALTLALSQLAQGGATLGQVAKWSGSAWAPADDAAGGGGGISEAPVDGGYYARRNSAWSGLGSAALAASTAFEPAGVSSSDIGDSTAAGRALLTDATAAAQRASLGLGALATHATVQGSPSGETDPGLIASTDDQGRIEMVQGTPALVGADAAGAATAAVSAHAGAADPHTGYRLESAALPWADLSGVPSSFAPSAHAASHGSGQADALSLAATQISSGTLADARSSTTSLYEWIEIPITGPGPSAKPTAAATFVADLPYTATLNPARRACQGAPTVTALVVDVRAASNWGTAPTTVLSSDISLGAGSYEASGTVSTSAGTAGDHLAVVVESVDSGATAADCIVTLSYTRPSS